MHDDERGDAHETPRTIEELQFVPTADLLNELFSRYPNAVFMGGSPVTSDSHDTTRKWYGDPFVCQGYATHMAYVINDSCGSDDDEYEEDD